MRTAGAMTREQQVLALLVERRGEKLTGSDVAAALVSEVENVRSAIKRLHKRGEIRKEVVVRVYKVDNSTCRHKALLWYVAVKRA